MDPELTLRRMCAKHGVPLDVGRPLMPLVERAARAPEEVRKKLLAVVEATLAREGAERAASAELEQRMLNAVASALHRWPGGEKR